MELNTDQYTVTETSGTVVTFSNADVYPGRFEVTAADDGGWAAGAHHLQVQFDFVTTTYFSRGGGHFGLATHTDSTVMGTHVRGNGVLIGTCSNGYVQSSDLSPPYGGNIMLETWMGGLGVGSENIVYPGTDMPRGEGLRDGVNHRVIFDSCVDYLDRKWFRYRIYRKDNTWFTDVIDGSQGFWTLLHDSGYHYDSNRWADFTKTGLWFYEVFSPADTWSITFSNLVVAWGPYLGQAEEATANILYRNKYATNGYGSTGLFPRAEDGFGTYNIPDTFMMTGFDNTNITNAANATLWDWNTWVDADDIRSRLVSAGMSSTTADQIDTVFIPLVRVLAQLCKTAKKNGW